MCVGGVVYTFNSTIWRFGHEGELLATNCYYQTVKPNDLLRNCLKTPHSTLATGQETQRLYLSAWQKKKKVLLSKNIENLNLFFVNHFRSFTINSAQFTLI